MSRLSSVRGVRKSIAEEIGGEVIAVDPLAKDYVANMDNVSDIFAKNLV